MDGLKPDVPQGEVVSSVLSDDDIIAVVGIGCRFPRDIRGAEDYWTFLSEGRTAVAEFPADRFGVNAVYSENPDALGRASTKWGAFLGDVRGFDAAFFEISPREANSMDPQQRLLLEVVEDALEDACLTRQEVQDTRTGVFVGISTSDYGNLQRYQHTRSDVYAGTGSALSIAANRISHRFNLHGPSSSVDTACSSSLVALDQATVSLRSGRCDIALAGGVNVLTDPAAFIAFSKAGMLSQTGRISTFDERANGYVRGEGAGVVVLKRLSDAKAAGDRIYALLRATSVNQDGRTTTLTAPSETAQREMLEELCRRAGIAPDAVDYVEAHGTGTPVGDPIEASAIGTVFGQARDGDPVLVGSVKPNIGHLESAAGISGFIKTVLIAHHGEVPPNINFATPNPNIPFDALNIRVPQQLTPIGSAERAPLVVVNSFGFGGTNASALLEGVPREASAATAHAGASRAVVVPLSAASEQSLRDNAAAIADLIEVGERPVADIAASLGRYRTTGARRAAVIATGREDAVLRLRELAANKVVPLPRGQLPVHVSGTAKPRHRIAFTFAGQGGQWWKMARRLLQEDDAFSGVFNRFDDLFTELSGWSIKRELLRDENETRLGESLVAQPGIFGVEIGLAAAWAARGVHPDVVIGHSFGEASAAHVAGALSLEEATRLISVRAQMHEQVGPGGKMIAVGLSTDAVLDLIGADTGVDFGAFNTRDTTTLSGPGDAIDAVHAVIAAKAPDALLRRIDTDTAWHSRALRVAEGWFRAQLGHIEFTAPRIAFASTVTGRLETSFGLDYWWENLQRPVSYYHAVELALDLGADTFLELSPSRVLSGPNSRVAAERGAKVTVINSLQRDADDFHGLAVAAAELHCAGVALDWPAVTGGTASKGGLPGYAWDRQDYWHESEEAHALLFEANEHPLLGRRKKGPGFSWSNELNLTSERYLAGHGIEGDTIFPAAGYLEIMLAAGREALPEGVIELTDVEFLAAMFIGSEDDVLLTTNYDERSGLIEIASRVRDESASWIPRARGHMRLTDVAPLPAAPATEPTLAEIDKAAFYNETALHGLSYSGAFQSVEHVDIRGTRAVSEIVTPDETAETIAPYLAHPGPLDSALQTIVVLAMGGDEDEYPLYLPVGVRRMRIAGPLPKRFTAIAQLERARSGSGLLADYVLLDDAGTPVASIDGMGLRKANSRREASVEESTAHHLIENFVETTLPAAAADALADSDWRVIAETEAAARPVVTAIAATGGKASWAPLDAFLDFNRLDDALAGAPLSAGRSGIVFAAPYLVDGLTEAATGRDIAAAVERLSTALIGIGRWVNAQPGATKPEIVVLTRNSRSAPGQTQTSVDALVGTSMAGLVRTISNECAESAVLAIDADDSAGLDLLGAILTDARGETEWVLQHGTALVPRLRSVKASDLPRQRIKAEASGEINYVVTMQAPGSINGLVLEQTPVPAPGPGEVLLKTLAVGLNFRDVMAATGLLPAEAEPDPAWLNLGLEFSGTVVAIGEGVTSLAPGDRVMGMGRRCLEAYRTVPADVLVKLPGNVGDDDAATIPSAFATAWYALKHVARIQAGERILIHLGTGGVGLAAIQIARNAGAEIFATAGSESKRQYLRDLGIAHVMQSRSLSFFDDVMAATGGEGVDVVLNALPTAYIERGVQLLRPFGRFLEIGKRDVYANTPVGMHALRRNISFCVIDLAAMASDKPQLLATVFSEVVQEFEAGRLKALPLSRYPVDKSSDAFRLMSQARHIGKVVIGFGDGPVSIAAAAETGFALRREGNYLITGGSRGFGISVAEWLSANGAGEVTLASRSGSVDAELGSRIEAIRARGTVVTSVSLDVADDVAVGQLVARLATAARPLRGIVHGAAVVRDALIGQLDRDTIAAVIEPKVAGAWNLHRALDAAGAEVDFFVSFSSIAQVIGSVGQANYVAANAFLDGIAAYRRALGRPGLTIDWGALADAGFVARNDQLARYLDSMGMAPISDAEAFTGLSQSLGSDVASVAYARIDWSRMSRALGAKGTNPRLSDVASGRREGSHQIQAELAGAAPAEWPGIVQNFVIAEVATVLGADAGELTPARALTELGFDSLSSIELKNRLEGQLSLSFTVGAFLQAKTLKDLSQLIHELLVQKAKTTASAGSDTDAASAASDSGIDGFAPSPSQLRNLRLATGSMSTSEGRLALETAGSLRLARKADAKAVAEAWAQVCARHPMLTLVAQDSGLVLGAAPQVETTDAFEAGLAAALDLAAGQPVRAIASANGMQLGLRAQASVADRESIDLALAEWGDLVSGKALSSPPARAEVFAGLRAQRGDADTAAAKSDRAYWRATLTPWVPAASLTGRRVALTPSALGLNRGATGRVERHSSAATEAAWLAAFALALARQAKAPAILVERHLSRPQSATVGPWQSSMPVVLRDASVSKDLATRRVARQLELGTRHAGIGLAALEAIFAEDIAATDAVPGQFGFSYGDAAGHPPDRIRHDIHLVVADTADTSQLTLLFDTAVIDEAAATALLADIAALLGEPAPAANRHLNGHANGKANGAHPAVQTRPILVAANAPQAAPAIQSQVPRLPVLASTRTMLSLLQRPEATRTFIGNWNVNQALLVRPGIDLHRMNAALANLLQRHETLRMRFPSDRGELHAVIDERYAGKLNLHDLGNVTRQQMLDAVNAIASQPFDLESGPLFELHVFKCGKIGDVVLVHLCEFVADGWSISLIIDELVRHYLGMGSPSGDGTRYLDLLAATTLPEDSAQRAALDTYWRAVMQPLAPQPVFGRTAKGYPAAEPGMQAPYQRLSLHINRTGLNRLRKRASALHVSENALWSAAIMGTATRQAGAETSYFSAIHPMRNASGLNDKVAMLMGRLPVRCDVGATRTFDALARQIHDRLTANNEHAHPGVRIDAPATLPDGRPTAQQAWTQWAYGRLLPENVLKSSMAAPLIGATRGKAIQILTYHFESLPMQPYGFTQGDFVFRPLTTPDGIEISFFHDLLSLTGDEATALLMEAMDALGLEAAHLGERDVSGVMGHAEDLDRLRRGLAPEPYRFESSVG